MTYGFGRGAGADGKTDRDRAYYAETGQSALRIRRPFFGLSDGDMDVVAEIAGDEWDARAAGATGRRGPPGAAAP